VESGWAELLEELLMKVLEALQAAEQCAPQDRGWAARPLRRCGWCAVGGSAVVTPDVAVAETGCHRRGGRRD
jgi:hypothetical protein